MSTVFNSFSFWLNHVQKGKKFRSCGVVSIYSDSKKTTIRLGDNVYINSARVADPLGGDTKTVLATFGEGHIEIGNNVGISNTTMNSHIGIKIGDDVMIGANVKIYDTDFHAIGYEERINKGRAKMKRVEIKRGAFIGSSVIILKGTVIGENSVIGAGSVVSGTVPPNQVWAGNPARFVKKI